MSTTRLQAKDTILAVLGDQKSGTNIEAPESLIRKIVREEAGTSDDAILSALQSIESLLVRGQNIVMDTGVLVGQVTRSQRGEDRRFGR